MFPARLRPLAVAPAVLTYLWLSGCSGEEAIVTPPGLACGDPGDICTVMGTGQSAYLGEGQPPEEVALYGPIDMTFDREGPDAELDSPCGLAVHSSGYPIYFADTFNHAARRIDPSGIITTIVGTGVEGADGDGGPATEAQLNHPSAILFGPDGNLWVADAFNSKIRRVVLSSP